MTEEELAMIERDYQSTTGRDSPLLLARGVAAYIPDLVAEVRRLRGGAGSLDPVFRALLADIARLRAELAEAEVELENLREETT